jgi:DNA-binding NtrC family response regulator
MVIKNSFTHSAMNQRYAIISNVKIAVVESDRLTREFIVDVMMYSVNRKVLSFASTTDITAYLHAGGEIDLLLAEIHSPDTSGVDLLKTIKSEYPKTLFVALSANPDDETTAGRLKADAFLTKPFALQDLFAIVQQFVVQDGT